MKLTAKTPDELKQLVEENPYEFPSMFLADESFALHCYATHSFEQLNAKVKYGQPDPAECAHYELTDDQWREQVEMARLAQMFELESLPSA
ncbi:hypothetical protein JCM14469_27120 [Desulfatiferula olefinivorans]